MPRGRVGLTGKRFFTVKYIEREMPPRNHLAKKDIKRVWILSVVSRGFFFKVIFVGRMGTRFGIRCLPRNKLTKYFQNIFIETNCLEKSVV